ncbi:hypothetical protein QBC36DRAFT_299701 [Triangularia setosa]|uniref:Uncharacterized protein n=1 Tax=Triangularia setosa TaxID=2587417 RepID=A0AAN6WA56_9PEZI|nr:hypothetical protein QBC36DRAFT_299701 [Podospora setosa]
MVTGLHAIYHPLNSSRREIRLLSVTGVVKDRLTCHLSTVSLTEDAPSFTALSYVWVDPRLTDTIVVDGVKVGVTSNLDAVLKTTVYDLAYAAAKLQATDQKDYVYGMLGVTGLSINPDYNDDLQFCELKFLYMAGMGFFDSPFGYPSWVPQFSGIAEKPPGTPPWLFGIYLYDNRMGAEKPVEGH